MQGDVSVDGDKLEAVAQVVPDEFHRLVQFHAGDALAQAVQAGALVTYHRVFALLAGLPQGLVKFGGLAVGDVKHALGLPDGAAAHPFQSLGEDDLVARLAAQPHHLVDEGVLHGSTLGQSHRLVDARGEIDHLEAALLAYPARPWLLGLSGHRGCPQGQARLVHGSGHASHGRGSEHVVAQARDVQGETQAALDAREMTGGKPARLVAHAA